MLRTDLQHLAARNLHELLRCWELWHRTWVGEAHMRHMLFRQETRWPGYYYRADSLPWTRPTGGSLSTPVTTPPTTAGSC